MNIVLPDCHVLPNNIDFPPLATNNFAWQQFLGLNEEELKEHCSRTHCVVTFNTPINADALDSMSKLELLVVANHDISLIDMQTVEKNNVSVISIPDLNPSQFDINNPQHAQQLCNTVVEVIDHYMLQSKSEN